MAVVGEMVESAEDGGLIGQALAFLWVARITGTVLAFVGQWKTCEKNAFQRSSQKD